jgi:hypothetical protein
LVDIKEYGKTKGNHRNGKYIKEGENVFSPPPKVGGGGV